MLLKVQAINIALLTVRIMTTISTRTADRQSQVVNLK
jgi:hypothetical protein